MDATNEIQQIIKVDKVRNDCARITYLLNSILKHRKELEKMGVVISEPDVNLIETFGKDWI